MELEYTICGKLIMREITKKPRLLKIRDKLILQLRMKGFFLEEIGEIFRLQKSRVGKIINENKGRINNKS